MTPKKWERLQELFGEGLTGNGDYRARILRDCAGEPEVARALEDLWAAPEPPSSFLNPKRANHLTTENTNYSPLLKRGDVLGDRFTILELIGTGGMGEVYLARDDRLQRIVAVKILPERVSADTMHRQRLELEARAISSLSHPNICALHDLGADGDRLYLIMEYVRGETLEQRLRKGPLAEADAVRVALEVCAGLSHAHENGLIHRDLKPSNVMLSPSGAKILDFGIATRTVLPTEENLTQTSSAHLTGAGQVVGTPAYMSPEQAHCAKIDARSDIFSLGVLLFEMLTGTRALPSGPVASSPLRFDTQPGTAAPGVSVEVRNVVQRCLKPDPDERYQSVADLGRALCVVSGAESPRSHAIARWAGVAAAVACLGTVMLWPSRAGFSASGQPELSTLTSYPGCEYHPTLSPDGRNVAFLWDGETGDNIDVYVQAIGSDHPLRLTTDPAGEKWPQWSPDGKWIAFARNKYIYLISPLGSPERLVTEKAAIIAGCDEQFSWTDAGHLVFTAPARAGGAPGLAVVDIDARNIHPLTKPDASTGGDWCPVTSQDGHRVFYRHRPSSGSYESRRQIAAIQPNFRLEAGREVPWIQGATMAWAPNNREIIYSRELAAGAFLFRVNVDQETAPQQLPFGEEGMYPALSRTGNRLVYMRRQIDVDIVRAKLVDGNRIATEKMRAINSSRWDTSPEYSPDGSLVAFVSNRAGSPELWIARVDRPEPKRLARVSDLFSQPRWSPDGTSIVIAQDDSLALIDAKTGVPQRLDVGTSRPSHPSYSRDGKWVYFSANRNGNTGVWRIPSWGGQQQTIVDRGFGAVESFDGRDLYFLRDEDAVLGIYVVPSSGGREQRIGTAAAGRAGLLSTASGLYYVNYADAEQHSAIFLYFPEARRAVQIAELPTKGRLTASGLSLAPDGKSFLYSAFDLQTDLMLVDHFR